MNHIHETKLAASLVNYYYSEKYKLFDFPVDTYNGWVILAPENGSFRFRLDQSEEKTVSFGEIVLCPPGVPLYRYTEAPIIFHYIQFHVHVRDDKQPASFPSVKPPYGKIVFHDLPRFTSTLNFLKSYKDHYSNHNHLLHLINDMLYQSAHEYISARRNENRDDPLILKAKQYIRENAYGDISIESVAHHFGLSHSRFTRRFRAIQGVSPIEYLTAVRLHKARSLLLETDFTLDQIAGESGYQNAFYFSRVFQKHMRTSPSQFRISNRI